ncbi:MAG: RecX family transcriptional regulator [Flavobacteriales bacterium]|nr:RecX family transcriptional regulator [Flavobacteriales bacterium]
MFGQENIPQKATKSYVEAWAAIQKYCVYQERCHKEVRSKLYDFGLKTEEVNELISRLIEQNFLNEERFAVAFAGGKFRVKNWGKEKIKRELKLRGISDYCINKALKEISDDDNLKTLEKLIAKKSKDYLSKNKFEQNAKVARYCIVKGYEPEMVWQLIKNDR